jgi:hypothetical protein
MDKKLVPYSVYLPIEQHIKLKDLAKSRKASALIRDAITMDARNANDSAGLPAIKRGSKNDNKSNRVG